jgi:hypothetical protein
MHLFASHYILSHKMTTHRSRDLRFARAFVFFLGLCPSCERCFAGKLLPLLWRERCHARFSALAAGGLPALSAHLAHHFGN